MLTSILKVKRQGQVIYFGLFEIADLENVEIDTKIEPVACIQPEIKKRSRSCTFDLDFQGQPSKSRD